jgi:hypothetical protein
MPRSWSSRRPSQTTARFFDVQTNRARVGRSADAVSLGEVLDLLKREGETILLKMKRGGQTMEISLRLHALI